MTDISDLRRRVDAVGQKFGRLAEQENRYGERLTGLLNAVEEGFARSQRETQELRIELESAQKDIEKLQSDLEAAKEAARQRRGELDGAKEERDKLASELDGAKDESKQLRGMLLTLLEAVESGGDLEFGAAMRKLESRIDRIVTSSDGGPETEPATTAADLEPDTPESVEDMATVATSEGIEYEIEEEETLELASGTELVLEPPSLEDFEGDAASPDELVDEILASEVEPPAEPGKPKEEKKAAAAERKAAEPPSDDDLSAVNKIIQRISLLTGEFVEPSEKRSGAARDKPLPSLKIDNDAADAEEGSGAETASSDDESNAKTS